MQNNKLVKAPFTRDVWKTQYLGWDLSHKKWTPIFSSPQSKYIEIFGPLDSFIEIFGVLEPKILIYLGPFEILYPPLNLHSTHCVKGDNLFHLKYI